MTTSNDTTRVRALLHTQEWRRIDSEESARDTPHRIFSVHVSDPFAAPIKARLATVDLILGRRAQNGAAVWLLWTDLNDGITPEWTEWVAPDDARPFDTRHPDGRATDALIAHVVPTLRAYLARVAPHLKAPDAPALRWLFTAALADRPA